MDILIQGFQKEISNVSVKKSIIYAITVVVNGLKSYGLSILTVPVPPPISCGDWPGM